MFVHTFVSNLSNLRHRRKGEGTRGAVSPDISRRQVTGKFAAPPVFSEAMLTRLTNELRPGERVFRNAGQVRRIMSEHAQRQVPES
jgi:hypothetical protein